MRPQNRKSAYLINSDQAAFGFITLEIVVALMVTVLSLSGFLLFIFGGQALEIDSETGIEALQKAESLLESSYSAASVDFNLVNSLAKEQDGIYAKSLEVEMLPDLLTKRLTAKVSWQAANGRTNYVSLYGLAVNLENSLSPDTCNSSLSGDWKNPVQASYNFGPEIANDFNNIFPISSMDAYFGRLYVGLSDASNKTLPTLFVLDIQNPKTKPDVLGSLDNNPASKAGISALRASGNFAFLASALGANFGTCANTDGQNASCGQLQIVDISAMPMALKYTMKMPAVTGQAGQGVGKSLFIKDRLVYLGLTKTLSGPEFNIIDISDPLNPVWKGGYKTGSGVNAIYVKNDYAYLATPDNEELTVLDVSDPSHPKKVSGFDAPDNQGNGKSLFIIGNNIFLGRTVTSGNPEFYVLSQPDKTLTPGILGGKEISSSVNQLLVKDYLAFLLTNSRLHILNIADPANITDWAAPISLQAGGVGSAMDCEQNAVYFSALPANNKSYLTVLTPGL